MDKLSQKTMNQICSLFFLISLFVTVNAQDLNTIPEDKPRLIILADMGNEPDEVQQMVHMITCANEFEIEGLIAVTGKYLRPETKEEYRRVVHPELFHEIIDAYAEVIDNLRVHAKGWPEPKELRAVVASGQKGYGIADVGLGKSSEGSKLIVAAIKKKDPRPIWIVVNAGSNTLAQTLVDLKSEHTEREMNAFLSKLRVFENGAQDNAGAWICNKFPSIHWIRSNYQTYAYGGPGAKDGDLTTNLGPHYWKPYQYNVTGQNEWLFEHVMLNHGPLGKVYPERRYHGFRDGGLGFMEGGGTIPWMGLVNKGLFDINEPSWGGWGGRFTKNKVSNFWSRHVDIKVDEEKEAPFYTHCEVSDYWVDPQDGKEYNDNYVPVWRWREAMFNDQKSRMDWCVASYEEANHHPIAAFNSDKSNTILRMKASPGAIISLDGSNSFDPDGDALDFKWWVYLEAGNYAGNVTINEPTKPKTNFTIPTGAGNKQIHVILEIKDKNAIAPLYDYRRIVIDVDTDIIHEPNQED